MVENLKLKGLIVPLLTPFDGQGAVDEAALRRLTDFAIARGAHGLFPGGTTGEGPLLSLDEHRRVAEIVVDAAGGRVPVIVHAGTASTRDTGILVRHAQAIGAQAAAVVTPYYYRLSDAALLHHYEQIAAQAPDFPIYLYNIPQCTGNALSLDVIAQITERCPNIVGMKDSSGSLGTLVGSLSLRGGTFHAINGDDTLILPAFAMGIETCVSGNSNVFPELFAALYEAAWCGDLAGARRLQNQINAVSRLMDYGDAAMFKAILARRGLPVGSARSPLLTPTDAVAAERWRALSALELDLLPL